MPLYVVERTFAEQLELSSDDVRLIEDVNADEGVSWLFTFLTADKRRSYCLYEAPSPEAIVEAIFTFYENRGFEPSRADREKMLNL